VSEQRRRRSRRRRGCWLFAGPERLHSTLGTFCILLLEMLEVGGGGTYPPYAIQSEWRVQVLETALALATPVWRIGAGGLDSTSRSLEVSMVAMVVEGGMEMERKGDVGFGYIWRGLLRVLWFE